MQSSKVVHTLIILLIETEFAGPDLITQKLSHFGYSCEVLLVKDWPGYEAAFQKSPDLILTDLRPDGIGQELLRTYSLDIPLIVLVSDDQQELGRACLARGASDYLLAGDLSRLGHSLGQILRLRQYKNELESAYARVQSLEAARSDSGQKPENSWFLYEYGKQVEKVLVTERQLADAQRIAHLGSYQVDYPQGKVVLSEETFRIIGIDPSLASDYIQEYMKIVHPEDRNHLLETVVESITQKLNFDFVFRIILSGGEEKYLRSIGVPVLNDQGEVIQVTGTIQDITTSRLTELALAHSEQKYRTLVQSSVDAIVMTDEEGRIIEWNLGAERIFGLESSLVLGRSLWDVQYEILPDEKRNLIDQEYQKQVVRTVLHTGVNPWKERTIKIPFRRKDGEIRIMSNVIYSVKTEKGYFLCSISRDITEQEQADKLIRESEEKYRNTNQKLEAIIQASPVAMIAMDLDGQVSLWSSSAENMFGWKADEVIGRDLPYLALDEMGRIYEEVEQERKGGTFTSHETRRVRKNGEWFDVSISAGPVSNAQGQTTGIMATLLDITAQKQIELELRDSEEKFRALVEQSSDGIMMGDEQGRIIEWNRGSEIILGLSREQLIGKFIWEAQMQLMLPERRNSERYDFFKQRILDALKDGHSTLFSHPIDAVIQRADGEIRFTQQIIFPISTRKGVHIGSITRDITKRKRAEEEIRRQAAFANALAVLTGRLSTALDSEKVLEVLCEELLTALNLSACGVYLYAEQKHELLPAYNYGMSSSLWSRLHAINIPADWMIRVPNWAFLPADQHHSVIPGLNLAGMVYQDQLVGAVAIPISETQRDYTDEERLLIQAFTRQAAIAMINLRLYQETNNRARELEDLAMVSSSLRQARTLAELVPLLIAQTIHVMNADHGTLFFYPEEHFTPKQIQDLTQPGPEWRSLLSQINLQEMPENTPAYFISRTEEGARNELSGNHSQSGPIATYGLAIVKSVESLIGFLCVGYSLPHVFEEDEKRMLVAIAEMAGNAIHRTNIMDTLEQRVQVRTRELEALYEIARLASGSIDLDSILKQSLDRVLEIYHVKSGLIQLLTDDGAGLELAAHRGLSTGLVKKLKHVSLEGSLAARVIHERQALISMDLSNDQAQSEAQGDNHADVYLGAPIRAKGEILGVVSIYSNTLHSFNVEEIALLETIANQIGVAVESARLRRHSEQAAIVEERQRLARDLHDSVTQSLFSLNLLAEGYRRHASQASPQELDEWFAELGSSAHQALKDMRLLLYELRPSTIQQDGLAAVIQRRLDAVEGRSDIKSRFKIVGDPGLLNKMEEIELYHIIQEALNNALKHAAATAVEIRLSVRPKKIQMEISDNGIGFEVQAVESGGMGLGNMVERAKRLSGKLIIQSQPGKGTLVRFIKEGYQ
jgi:PAS domain S-box-containing protein